MPLAKVIIFHARAGEGHRKIAEALYETLTSAATPTLDVRCLDGLDYTYPIFRKNYASSYHFMVTHMPKLWGWFYFTLDKAWIYGWMKYIRRAVNGFFARPLRDFMVRENPDVIVCTHFLGAEVAAELKRAGKIHGKVLTLITDYGAHTLWVNKGTDAYAVMHQRTADMVVERGGDRNAVRVTGIPVHRNFLAKANRAEVFSSLGLDPSKKMVLLTSGGFGFGPTEEVIKHLEFFSNDVQLVVVCGHNQILKNHLDKISSPLSMKILGFVDFMPKLMTASDLVIAKAGGSTVTECLAVGVPLVIHSFIPGQEGRNIDLLEAYDAARYLKNVSDIREIMDTLVHKPEKINEWRKNMQKLAKPQAANDVAAWVRELAEKNG